MNGKTVQDASRTFAEVMGSSSNVQFAKYSLDLGDSNLLQPDESKPLTFFRVEHGSIIKGSALYNFTIPHNGAVATIMLVCIKGDADLLVAHGQNTNSTRFRLARYLIETGEEMCSAA